MNVAQLKFALALPTLLLSTSALGGIPNWTMSESSGQVTVASSGMVRVANRGATLSAGDVISTGAKGRAVIVRGQEYLVVAPNSRIRVADPAQSGGMTQIIEQIGNVVYKIKKMATPHFAVETPFLAAVVKGTTFSVTVTESGASVQVIEGRVEVETRDGGARYLVLPGDIGSVSAKALGRLNVQGRETLTIVSPTEGKGVATPTAELLQADPVATGEASAGRTIDVAVSEPAVQLGAGPDNMVSGVLVAAVTMVPLRQSAFAAATPIAETPATVPAVVTSSTAGTAVVTQVENPVAAPVTAPVTASVTVQVPAPVTVPATAPVTAPVTTPVTAPVNAPVTAPATAPATAPVTEPATAPVITPVTAPVTAPATAPMTTPVTAPVTAPVVMPVTAPVASPATAPVTAPVTAPAAMPVTAPVTAPVTGPVTAPVTTPAGNGNNSSPGTNNGNGVNGRPGGNNGNGVNGTGSGNNGSGSGNGNGNGNGGNNNDDKGNGKPK